MVGVTVGVIVLVAVSVGIAAALEEPESEEFVLGLILTDEDIVGHRVVDGNTE
jgi:hypothetical protein